MTNLLTCLLAGVVVFAYIGILAETIQRNVNDVVADGIVFLIAVNLI